GAYLFASGEQKYADGLSRLCGAVVEALRDPLGPLLLIEVWSLGQTESEAASRTPLRPQFRIAAPRHEALAGTVEALAEGLRSIKLHGLRAEVEIVEDDQPGAPGLEPLRAAATPEGGYSIGIGV